MKHTIYKCDVCGKEADKTQLDMQVIFVTEQNEGTACAPHFCMEKLDLCNDCLKRALEGNYIFGAGAMGCNQYFFKDEKRRDHENKNKGC